MIVINSLPNEILADIFRYVITSPDGSTVSVNELVKLERVCKLWSSIIEHRNSLWKYVYLNKTFTKREADSHTIFSRALSSLSGEEEQEEPAFYQERKFDRFVHLSSTIQVFRPVKAVVEYGDGNQILARGYDTGSVEHNALHDALLDFCSDTKKLYAQTLAMSRHFNVDDFELLHEALDQSSFDSPMQTIRETLKDSESFWSSTGSETPAENEHLIYKLRPGVNLITHITMMPYKALYLRGMPTFAPKQISFSVGFYNSSKENDKSVKYHYTSKAYGVHNVNSWQTFSFPPTLVVGDVLRLNLIGKYQTQPTDDKYYTVLQQVKCSGVPVAALSACGWNSLAFALLRWADLIQNKPIPSKEERDKQLLKDLNSDVQALVPSLIAVASRGDFLKSIRMLLAKGRWDLAAAKLAETDIYEGYRTQETLNWLKSSSLNTDTPEAFSMEKSTTRASRFYLRVLINSNSALNDAESVELALQCIEDNNWRDFHDALANELIEFSETLGDTLSGHDNNFAQMAYLNSGCIDKFVKTLLKSDLYLTGVSFAFDNQTHFTAEELFEELLTEGGTVASYTFTIRDNEIKAKSMEAVDRAHKFALTLLDKFSCGIVWNWLEVRTDPFRHNPVPWTYELLFDEDELISINADMYSVEKKIFDQLKEVRPALFRVQMPDIFRELFDLVTRKLSIGENELNLQKPEHIQEALENIMTPTVKQDVKLIQDSEELNNMWLSLYRSFPLSVKLSIVIHSRLKHYIC
ncbi:hypothetical protein MP638_001996 [Amoeboaphelidium occidentale]|nr:hypothetical protein MP638_001996 [Amoeboaphelidium occidentale]